MHPLQTERLLADQAGIARTVEIWRNGGLVAFPTETVYGLGADATKGAAVANIYAAKDRPAFNPLIIHVADLDVAHRFARFSKSAEDLARAFWPGPLSLVLPLEPSAGLSSLVTAGLDTVAVRVPQNPLAHRLLAVFGGAIAAPSANPSGRISPTSAEHVFAGLDGRIDAVIDGGVCDVGVESTIVDPNTYPPALLRPGGLPPEAISAMLGQDMVRAASKDAPNSPGQLASHYAPAVAVRLDVPAPQQNALWLGFGPDCSAADENLSPSGDLHEAAANLFACLHRLDKLAQATTKQVITVAPIPKHSLGLAINDRLQRAAAPRAN